MPSKAVMKTRVGKQKTCADKSNDRVVHQINDQFSIALIYGGKNGSKRSKKDTLDVCIDSWFDYPALRNYHGPSSIIEILKFREIVDGNGGKRICVLVDGESRKRANAVVLVGAYLVLWGGIPTDTVISMVSQVAVKMPQFQTEGEMTFPDLLSIQTCIRSLTTFKDRGLFDPDQLSHATIQHYEDPMNGDMNWIVPGQFLAFAGPGNEELPQFIKFAKENCVRAVVRLNEKEYDGSVLEKEGIKHLDLEMEDGSVPSLDQIRQFYNFVDPIIEGGGSIAVHCRAGLGRTGTMIGTYLIRKYRLEATETIAFCRIMRPGMFLTKQPRFVEALQCWLRGEEVEMGEEEGAFVEGMLGAEMASQLGRPF